MHIGIVIDTYDSGVNAGGVISTQRFVNLLRKAGHKVTIITTGTEAPDKVIMPTYSIKVPYVIEILKRFKITLAKPDDNKLNDILQELDIIHIEFPFHLGKRAIELAKEKNIPVVSTFHVQAENITYNLSLNNQKVIKTIYSYFINNIFNKSNFVISPSAFAKNELLHYGLKTETEVISNGVSEEFKYLNLKKDNNRFTILTVGRLGKEKKQEIILQALAKSKFKDKIQLTIVGDGTCRENLIDMGKQFNITPRFLRGIPIKELVHLYNTTDLYVHSGEVELECMAVLEAISCKLVPLIANSEKSAAPQFALDERSLFEKSNPEDLAKKIDYWYSHPKELQEISNKYLQESKKYNIKKSNERIIAIYKRLISENKKATIQPIQKKEISRLKTLKNYFKFGNKSE
ncbi:glycosyltransferase [Candidatus Woesearchaeota archaeon]|nr:glycosyltransferase [Candidatus Woesearchaeota archaeon]